MRRSGLACWPRYEVSPCCCFCLCCRCCCCWLHVSASFLASATCQLYRIKLIIVRVASHRTSSPHSPKWSWLKRSRSRSWKWRWRTQMKPDRGGCLAGWLLATNRGRQACRTGRKCNIFKVACQFWMLLSVANTPCLLSMRYQIECVHSHGQRNISETKP